MKSHMLCKTFQPSEASSTATPLVVITHTGNTGVGLLAVV